MLFFCLFFHLYWWINEKGHVRWRNLLTIAASYVFYSSWDWRFLGLIILSSAVDFSVGLALDKSQEERARKQLLTVSILVNLGVLGFFKYFNFFVDSFQQLLSVFSISLQSSTLDIVLPVGISFYTFQTMSYSWDVYRRKLPACRDPLVFFAFVSFFPQLVAGPIERAGRLLGQFERRASFGYQQAVGGLRLVLWGLFKKVVLADNFGLLADQLFDQAGQGSAVWAAAFFFSIQIYADFSGYSYMAIGCARLLGIELVQNFRTPYFATSLSDYWRRWHISLSEWFRDYVYIPLGGNRGSRWQVARNLMLTFVLSGLWHGAQITFVLWGALHGVFLILEKRIPLSPPLWLRWMLLYVLVVLLWLPFRAEDSEQLWQLCQLLWQVEGYEWSPLWMLIESFSVPRFTCLLAILGLFTAVEYQMQRLDFADWIGRQATGWRWGAYYLLVTGILLMGNFEVKPQFIYFQF
ncbi:MAG: MBOAT family O-acyltransferase [Bacteroidota bacterium]